MPTYLPYFFQNVTGNKQYFFLGYIEEVAHAYAQNPPLEWFDLVDTWARSGAEAAERDLLVEYPVIDIIAIPDQSKHTNSQILVGFHAD